MIWPKMHIETAANGHLKLSWPSAGHSFYTLLCWWLRLRHGLRSSGRSVVSAPDQSILPDLVAVGFRLSAGWDNWSGYHLLSEDEAGDRFLKRLARADSAHFVRRR
jgi:hypothetical protein